MNKVKTLLRLVSTVFISFFLLSTIVSANTDIVGTQVLLSNSQPESFKHTLIETLNTKAIEAELVSMGVSPKDAIQRVQSLTNEEALALQTHLKDLPAGGADAVGIALFIFTLFVITDIVGATDIFPFIRPVNQ
ncbi:MAG: PA2779 family protein [Gammaproteobacteria bacterium]|nr:PA2779 family protein [Gammaproteobacteria bacterium]